MFRTVILVDLKDIGLCCNKFLGSRCIHCIGSSHRYKFEESYKKMEHFGIVHLRQIRWSTLNFYVLLAILRATEIHSA